MTDTFEDAYTANCEHCGDQLEWEWEHTDMVFKSTCSCLRTYALTPINAAVELTDEPEDDEEEEQDDE